jgi:AcrR family transcriptional regulator
MAMRRRIRVKTAYHHGNLRQDLVTAALAIINKEGPGALTLRAVARRLGVSQTAPYRHFVSKESLLAAVAAEGFATLLGETEATLAMMDVDPVARYVASAHSYVRFALAYPDHFRVMYNERPPEFSVGPVAESGRKAFQLFVETIVDCQKAGLAAAGDPSLVAAKAWAYAHGLAALHLQRLLPRRLDDDAVRALTREIVRFLNP